MLARFFSKFSFKMDAARHVLFLAIALAMRAAPTKPDLICSGGLVPCVFLQQCAPYMNLVMISGKPLNPALVVFLRSQQCGLEGGFPKVCCGNFGVFGGNFSELPRANPVVSRLVFSRPSATTTTTTATTKSKIATVEAKKPPRSTLTAEDLNSAFSLADFLDYESFDLLRRRRNAIKAGVALDIEIR